MKKLLELDSITKSFPGVKALSNVSFDLYKGEVHVLLGENGAGKSTLMKILSGVYTKDSGTIYKEEQEVEIKNTKDALFQGISIVYQEFNLCPHLTVAQNMFLSREFCKKGMYGILDEKQQNAEASRIMDLLKQNISPTEKIANLSVGEQQMVEIAKALTIDSDVIVMDEPTSALTESEIENLFAVIHNLKEKQCGIIYISHRLHELDFIADRVTVLRDGEKIETLEYKDTDVKNLINLMVGRDMEHMFPKRHTQITDDVIFEVKDMSQKGKIFDVSFSLKKGEVLGVAGLMGAGRTEIARAIFGADHRHGGKIYVDGKEVNIHSPIDAIKNGICYLTEDRKRDGLLLNLSVLDNCVLANIRDYSRASIVHMNKTKQVAEDFISLLSIKTPSMMKRINELSGGNQQKVIIARWLALNCQVVIFDEPTRGIDVGAKYEIYEIINSLSEKGVGVIMISSELPELFGMCSRILVVNSGRIAGECNPKEVDQEAVMHLAVMKVS